MTKLDRETYRAVKKMNKEELEDLLMSIYDKGVQSAEASRITTQAIEERIRSVPGIGEKRLAQIMDAISTLLEE
jgi:hypothetical protein